MGEVTQTDNEYQYLLYQMSASLQEFSYTCSACKFLNNRQQKYKNSLCINPVYLRMRITF